MDLRRRRQRLPGRDGRPVVHLSGLRGERPVDLEAKAAAISKRAPTRRQVLPHLILFPRGALHTGRRRRICAEKLIAISLQVLDASRGPCTSATRFGVVLDQSLYALDSTAHLPGLWAKFRTPCAHPAETCGAISPHLSALPTENDVILDEIAPARAYLRYVEPIVDFERLFASI